MRAGGRPASLYGVNVLFGLAEGFVDAVLERDEDPERDPFAMALERYRERGMPDEARGAWRELVVRRAPEEATDVLRKLDRDLLSGLVSYATAAAAAPDESALAEGPAAPTLALIGAAGRMPSLELSSDGTWHVAETGPSSDERRAADKTKAGIPTLASRYPKGTTPDRY